MKKLSVLLVAAVVALGASAGVNFKSTHNLKSNKIVNPEMTKINLKAGMQQTASFRAVIGEQPEGESKTFERTAGRYDYVSSGYLYVGDQPAKNRVEIVYGEDNKVWVKNILCGANLYFGSDSWVEGTIEDDIYLVVPMGQSIAYVESYDADIILVWGNVGLTEDGYFTYTPDPDVTEAVYEINGDTITLLGTNGPTSGDGEVDEDYLAYGLTAYWSDDDSWTGFMEWGTVLTEGEPYVAPTVITDIPENCQVYEYYRNSAALYQTIDWESFSYVWVVAETDGKFRVAFDSNGDAYIQNPLWYNDSYNTWVKGTYDWMTGIISVPVGQYLSWTDAYEYGMQLVWGSSNVEEGEDGYYLTQEIDQRAEEIDFMIDGDDIYLLGTEGDVYAEFPENFIATGMAGKWSDEEGYTSLEFCNRDEYGYAEPFGKLVDLQPAVPANPTADEWYDCGDESGYSRFYFTLPTEDVDGNPLDPEYVSFSIFVDNGNGPEIFTFENDVYYFDEFYQDITEVPYWLYSNAVDFHDYYIYMYRTNEEGYEPLFTENIGIQAYYTVNGVKNASEIVWLYDIDTNVNEMVAGKTVANVRYFNVAGQEMAQPSGMTIMVTTYTDGTTNTVKVVK